MIELVLGKDFIPGGGNMRGGTVVGNALALDGHALMPPWAFAVYTAPLPPRFAPSQITLYLDNVQGTYDVGLWVWDSPTSGHWTYIRNQTSEFFTAPIGSAFWSIHVYGESSLTIIKSEFEAV